MATYLVTGGCGFIGSHLVDHLLDDGHSVRILDDLSTGRREHVPATAELIIGSICDRPLVARVMERVDGCFHLAAVASVARSVEDWPATHAVNLTGTINVFDAAQRHSGKSIPVVYASSAAVYGDSQALPLSESGPTKPISPYGADKLACELHARAGGIAHQLPSFGVRFFNIYGPRQDPTSPYSGVISILTNRALAGLPITIHGDGLQSRDFVYVSDAVYGLRSALAAASPEAPVANICTGTPSTVLDLANKIRALTSPDVRIEHGPVRIGDIRRSVGDPTAAHQRLNWRAAVSLADGLQRTLQIASRPPHPSARFT
jgi:UDP-glucose 4-epimerase